MAKDTFDQLFLNSKVEKLRKVTKLAIKCFMNSLLLKMEKTLPVYRNFMSSLKLGKSNKYFERYDNYIKTTCIDIS